MKERLVWIDGELVPESKAQISIYDSALMFGDMVFEMTRSFNKVQFKLHEHLERLYASIKFAHIPFKMPMADLEAAIHQTIQANDPLFEKNDEHRVMINVTRGALGFYHDIKDIRKEPYAIIADFPLRWTVAAMGHLFDSGINAVITSQRAIPASLLDPKVKNRSRMHYMLANIEAAQFKGQDNWALLLDPDGFIAEGTGDNFFIVKNKEIITPEGRNILRGISREYIFELSKQLKLKCVEKNIEPYDVMNADEAFMTGTPFCLLPVTKLNGEKIGDGKVGSIVKLLLDTWGKNVGVNIVDQIKIFGRESGAKITNAPTPYSFSGSKP